MPVVRRAIELAVRFDCFTDQILNINCLGDMCFDKRCLPGSVANRANGFFSTIYVNIGHYNFGSLLGKYERGGFADA